MLDVLDWDELQNWSEYTKILIGVFARVTPPFIVPLFLNAVSDRPFSEKLGTALVAAATFALFMIFFTFYGEDLLATFGITMAAFRIAGGVLLFILALDMIRSGAGPVSAGTAIAETGGGPRESWLALGIVPLGVPILAGPGSITTIVVFSDMHEGAEHKILVTGVLLVIALYIAIMLALAAATKKLFSPLFSTVLSRLMGLIVLAIAVEFILDGVAAHFPALETAH